MKRMIIIMRDQVWDHPPHHHQQHPLLQPHQRQKGAQATYLTDRDQEILHPCLDQGEADPVHQDQVPIFSAEELHLEPVLRVVILPPNLF